MALLSKRAQKGAYFGLLKIRYCFGSETLKESVSESGFTGQAPPALASTLRKHLMMFPKLYLYSKKNLTYNQKHKHMFACSERVKFMKIKLTTGEKIKDLRVKRKLKLGQ